MADRYGITFPGPKPTTPNKIERRRQIIIKTIAELDAERGVAAKK
jgi:hypothetical protein